MLVLEHDRITFAGKTVADLRRDLSPALRRNMEDEFLDAFDASEREWQEDEHAKALKAAYEEGRVAGAQDQEEAYKAEREEIEEKARSEGFDEGHTKGIIDGGNASDAARVQILLLALQEIHNLIQPIWVGIKEPNTYKARTIKIGEAKRAAQSACAAAHRALNAYREER